MHRTPPPPAPYPDGRPILPQSLMLTIKLEGAPGVHLVYDFAHPFHETPVTILDQGTHRPTWSFDDVILEAMMFLVKYYTVRGQWPAELRSPGAGRAKATEPS